MNAAALLSASHLSLQAAGRSLLSGLDWQVKYGELWCLLGRNGAGKTTLLRTAAGLHKAAGGAIHIAGIDPAHAHPERLAKLRGYMAQDQSDAFAWSVLDTVLLGRTPWRMDGQGDQEQERAMAMAVLRQLGLESLAGRNVQRLSGGERQRVALAALLLQDTPLMLLDEPLSHQDVAHQLAIMQLLRERVAQHAVIMSCHDINLAARYATHVLLLGEDQHWLGPAASVLSLPNLEAAYACAFSREGRLFMPQPD